MSTDEKMLRGIPAGDRDQLAKLNLSTAEIGLVYSFWYEDYVARLEEDGRRFPATITDIAANAFGRAADRQHLHKNPHITKRINDDLIRIGQDARSKKSREDALADRSDQLDSQNSDLQSMIDQLTEEKRRLSEVNKQLERDLDGARHGRREAMAAIDYLFETGRRVLL